MLLGNSSEWSTGRAYIPCPIVTIVNWCHTVMQTVRQHQEDVCWTKLTNILTSEANLEPSQSSTVEYFRRNSQRLKIVNYFRRKAPPSMFVWALKTPLNLRWLIYQKMCVSTKDMVPGLAHEKYLKNTTHSKRKI